MDTEHGFRVISEEGSLLLPAELTLIFLKLLVLLLQLFYLLLREWVTRSQGNGQRGAQKCNSKFREPRWRKPQIRAVLFSWQAISLKWGLTEYENKEIKTRGPVRSCKTRMCCLTVVKKHWRTKAALLELRTEFTLELFCSLISHVNDKKYTGLFMTLLKVKGLCFLPAVTMKCVTLLPVQKRLWWHVHPGVRLGIPFQSELGWCWP